ALRRHQREDSAALVAARALDPDGLAGGVSRVLGEQPYGLKVQPSVPGLLQQHELISMRERRVLDRVAQQVLKSGNTDKYVDRGIYRPERVEQLRSRGLR